MEGGIDCVFVYVGGIDCVLVGGVGAVTVCLLAEGGSDCVC